MDILERFGRRLRELRRSRSWSESELADRWGVDVAHVTEVEEGKTEVRILDLDRLAQVFDLSIAELLEGTDTRSDDGSD